MTSSDVLLLSYRDRKCFVTTAGCAGATKQRDKMCLWSTAGTPMTPGQAPPDTRMFAICLLLVCYLFAICLLPLPSAVKRLRHVSDVYIAAPQGCPFRIPVIFVRHASEINRPPCARVVPCLTAWPTPHGRTVNCAPVHRYQ